MVDFIYTQWYILPINTYIDIDKHPDIDIPVPNKIIDDSDTFSTPFFIYQGIRMAGKSSYTLLASAARTTTTTVDYTTPEDREWDTKRPTKTVITRSEASCFHFCFDLTAVSGSASLTITISGYDPTSTKYYTILTSTAITTTGTTIFKVGPSLPGTANLTANDFLPESWKFVITHATSDSVTYSIGMNIV